jgi:kinesin family protein 13
MLEEQQRAKATSLADRWTELTRQLKFTVQILELDENGVYSPVEVIEDETVGTGGIFQLRQGQQRRISATVDPVANSGTLPLICESVLSIAVGSPCVRSRLQRPLDSYQEDDLAVLRERWSQLLDRRREYLNGQIQCYINKLDKTELECEREVSLVNQWVHLTDERNAVIAPTAGSGVPGAPHPPAYVPPPGVERHITVLFLDLNADDLSTGQHHHSHQEEMLGQQVPVYGHNSILPKELAGRFLELPLVSVWDDEEEEVGGSGTGATASWDSSLQAPCLIQYLLHFLSSSDDIFRFFP